LEILYEIFSDIPRLGPGCRESTEKAFKMISDIPDKPDILDIGCGTGMQTIELARLGKGTVIGLDNHQNFLEVLEEKSKEQGFSEQVKTMNASMFDLDFDKESFDIIWSEGAIYIIGFEKGLKEWKQFLKPGGHVTVTELSWLKDNPQEEPVTFFENEYPDMKSIEENLLLIQKCGYTTVNHFILPDYAWWDDFYSPLEKRLEMLSKKYKNDNKAFDMINMTYAEIELYRSYSKWYGYVFYVMKK
jgi:ubiquinone/menaquinone biosynthesis C-methylase UbiE